MQDDGELAGDRDPCPRHAAPLGDREGTDGWLLYDYRGSNPLFWHILEDDKLPTRRAFFFVPQVGTPILLVHFVDQTFFQAISLKKRFYRGWEEMQAALKILLGRTKRLAIEYSEGGGVPTVSWVDAGTVELLRSWNHEIVSSADLFQVSAAAWDDAAIDSHKRACAVVADIKDGAFEMVRSAIRHRRTITEYDVQSFIRTEFEHLGLETEGAPVVQANAHSGQIHYEPAAEGSSPIGPGDWLLIDFWAHYPGVRNVYSDSTWGGYAGAIIPADLQRIFDIVREARDRTLSRVEQAWSNGEELQGWQLDRVGRDLIMAAGHGDRFQHRTGHSMGSGRRLHALGVNIDDLETHDTRRILPRTGFSIEPAIYLRPSACGSRSTSSLILSPG